MYEWYYADNDDADAALDELLCEYVDGTMDESVQEVFEECLSADYELAEQVRELRSTRMMLCRYGCRHQMPHDLRRRLRRRLAEAMVSERMKKNAAAMAGERNTAARTGEGGRSAVAGEGNWAAIAGQRGRHNAAADSNLVARIGLSSVSAALVIGLLVGSVVLTGDSAAPLTSEKDDAQADVEQVSDEPLRMMPADDSFVNAPLHQSGMTGFLPAMQIAPGKDTISLAIMRP